MESNFKSRRAWKRDGVQPQPRPTPIDELLGRPAERPIVEDPLARSGNVRPRARPLHFTLMCTVLCLACVYGSVLAAEVGDVVSAWVYRGVAAGAIVLALVYSSDIA